jgi:hypothetical protein
VAPSQRLRQMQVEDGRVDAIGCVRPCYPTFVVFNVLDPRGIVVIKLLFGPINRILEGWGSLPVPLFHFLFPRLEVCQKF